VPESQPVSKTDIALATADLGAIAVAQGPGAIPQFDTNLRWDSAAQKQTLVGQPEGSGGDRFVVQAGEATPFRVNKDGILIPSLTGSERPTFMKVKPKEYDPGYPCDFNFNISSHNFGTYINNVATFGWNDLGGSLEKTDFPTFREVWENNYFQSDHYLFERFVAIRHPITNLELRPFAIGIYTRDESGDFLDPFQADYGEAWSIKTHLIEDGTLLQKWQWKDTLEEWTVQSPGYNLFQGPSSSVTTIGGNGRSNILNLVGSSNAVNFRENGTRKYALEQSSNILYVVGPTKTMGYWNDSQFTSLVTTAVSVSGDGTAAANWQSTSSTDGLGNWGWLLHNSGILRLRNYTTGKELIRFGASGGIGFYGANAADKPTVSGSRSDGTALQSLLSALATLGLITDTTTS